MDLVSLMFLSETLNPVPHRSIVDGKCHQIDKILNLETSLKQISFSKYRIFLFVQTYGDFVLQESQKTVRSRKYYYKDENMGLKNKYSPFSLGYR